MTLLRSKLFYCSLLASSLLAATCALANPAPADISSTSVLGASPIYSPGIHPTMVVDRFGMIDDSLTTQQQQDIAKAISEWHADGIEYGVYSNALEIETELRYTLAAGAAVDLDGTAKTTVFNDNGVDRSYYHMSLTRSAFQAYLIDSAKLAIDLGADHIFMDVASVDFSTHSFDDEIVAEYLASSGIDIRSYLTTTKGYADTAALNAAIAAGDLDSDATWQAWVVYDKTIEENFFSNWSTTLHNYAISLGQTVKLSANRYIDGNDSWLTADYFDYNIAETFLDALGYPENNLDFFYKTSVAFGKRFWSWNFPNNTATLNGGDNQPSNQLDRMFVAQTFANGGLSQVGGAGWVNFSNGVYPQVTIADYQLVQAHPELFDHAEASEFAVLYAEASLEQDSGGLGQAFRGMTHLLSDAHRTWDVLFASNPARINSVEKLILSKLQQYNAVVLPQTKYLTDSQITLLEEYLNGGGTVIGTSTIATHDENGTDQSASRSFDDLFGSDAVDSTTYAGTVIAINANLGQQYYNNASDSALRASLVTDFETAVSGTVAAELTTGLPGSVHITRFVDAADGSHIYHLVNTSYDSAIGTINSIPPSANMTVPVPSAYSASVNVEYVSPESLTPAAISPSGSGNTRSFNLPAIQTWAILKVGSNMAAPQTIDNKPQSQAHFIDASWSSLDNATATGGVRPDTVDASGNFEFPYWYWSNTDFTLPYLASDDSALANVDLFYRYSPDNTSWSGWTLSSSNTESGDVLINTFSFSPPDGDGYYEFYYQSTDGNGNVEPVSAGSEVGYGFDTTAPGLPASFAENNGAVNGVWQNTVRNPQFSWPAPADNLSGIETAWLNLHNVSSGLTPANCTINNQQSTNSWTVSTSAECAGGLAASNLADGLYRVDFRSRDNSNNAGNTVDSMFSLRIGTRTVDAPENLALVAGDGEVTVHWTAPADISNFDEVRIYALPTSQTPTILNNMSSIGINDAATDTSLTISGLTNGTEYRIAIEAYNRSASLPGDLVTMNCSFTPGATPVTDCPAPSGSTSYEVSVTQTGGTTQVTEGGASDSYSVVLSAQPASDVTVNITNGAQTTTDKTSLVFTTANWNSAQTVTVSAVDDSDVEGNHSATISHSISSADSNYQSVTVADVSVSITDNDTAVAGSISVVESGTTTVTEGGSGDSYSLVLDSAPASDVTISLSFNSQITTSASTLIFTSANWNSAQIVTVLAVDDAVAEGAHNALITHTVSSSDSNFDGITIASVNVAIVDNDSASVSVIESGGDSSVSEGGSPDSFDIVLDSEPSAQVFIALSTDNQVGISSTPLTFDASNWNIPQTVTVSAVDDAIAEGAVNSLISFVVSSSDSNYDNIGIAQINVAVTDNDVAGVSIVQSSGNTALAEGGASNTYSLKLTSQPAANVIITAGFDSAQLLITPQSIEFTPTDWNTPQVVTVTAVDDSTAEATLNLTVSFSASSSDAAYNALSDSSVTLSITDNDSSGGSGGGTSTQYAVVLSQSNGATAVTEGGVSDSYSLVLSAQPSSDVTINIATDSQLSADVGSLLFTAANWDSAQTVTVTAVDDSAVEGAHSSTIIHSISTSDANYQGLSVDSLSVAITDNDSASTGGSNTTTESSGGGGGLLTPWMLLLLGWVAVMRFRALRLTTVSVRVIKQQV